jgi:hypothetical protein
MLWTAPPPARKCQRCGCCLRLPRCKCSSRSNVVLLKSATSRQVAGRSSPFIAHIGAGRRSWSCRLQRPTPDRRVVRMQDNGTRSRRVAACSSKGVNATAAGSPVARPREYAWQRIAEFGNDDVRHQALRFPRARAIRIIVFIQLAGCDLPATCLLVADFSRTRFDRWVGVVRRRNVTRSLKIM